MASKMPATTRKALQNRIDERRQLVRALEVTKDYPSAQTILLKRWRKVDDNIKRIKDRGYADAGAYG